MAKYLKPDSELGFIEDGVAVEFLKFNNFRHTILGFMLGDFDEEGNYVVSDEIKKELTEMPKHLVDSLENVEICQSYLKLDKPISFMVEYEGNKASLVLIEKLSFEANFKLNSGTYSNINEYVLDEVETSGEINRNVLYQRWNIGQFGGEEVSIFSCGEDILAKYFGLVSRFKYLLEANSVLLTKEEELEEIEAEYANSVFDILRHYPKLEECVKKQIKKTMSSKKQFFKLEKPNFSKTFNEVLVNAIESNISVLNGQDRKEFEAEHRNIQNVANIKRKDALEVQGNQVRTRELSGLTLREVAERYVEKINGFKPEYKKGFQRDVLLKNLETNGIRLGAAKQETNLVAKVVEKHEEVKAEASATKTTQKKDEKKAGAKPAAASKKPQKAKATTKDGTADTNSKSKPKAKEKTQDQAENKNTNNNVPNKRKRQTHQIGVMLTQTVKPERKEVTLFSTEDIAQMAGRNKEQLGVSSNKAKLKVGGGRNNINVVSEEEDLRI